MMPTPTTTITTIPILQQQQQQQIQVVLLLKEELAPLQHHPLQKQREENFFIRFTYVYVNIVLFM